MSFAATSGMSSPGDRDESVARSAESEPSAAHRPLVVGFAAVLVEEGGPRLRLHPQLVGGAAHRRPVAAAGRLGDERLLGGRERGRVGDGAGAVEFADDRARGIGAQLARRERSRHLREHRLDRLTREARARPGGRPQRDAPTRLERRDLRHPLDELDRRAAPHAGREALIAELDAGPLGDLAGEGRAMRVDEPAERLERTQVGEQLVVGHPDASSNPSTSASAERSCSSASRVPVMDPFLRDPLTFEAARNS